MYQNIFLSIFAISWLSERIYFYCIYEKNKSTTGLLNLNTKLNNCYSSEYNPIKIPENNLQSRDLQLNNSENNSQL